MCQCDVQVRTEYDNKEFDEVTTACTIARKRIGKTNERSSMACFGGEYEATDNVLSYHKFLPGSYVQVDLAAPLL